MDDNQDKVDVLDPDEAALAQAEKEAEEEDRAAEEARKGANADESDPDADDGEGDPKPKAEGEQQGKDTGKDEGEGGPNHMIPKARLDEVSARERAARERAEELERKLAEAQRQAAYYQGRSETQPKAEPEPKGPSPEEQIAELEKQVDDIWTKADEGEIGIAEARRQERAIEKQIAGIQQAAQAPEQKPQKDPDSLSRKEVLEANKQEMLEAVPELNEMLEQPGWGEWLRGTTLKAMEESGKPMKDNSVGEVLRYRQNFARIARQAYQTYWKSSEGTGGQQPATSQTQRKSEAAEQRERKHALADNHPPDTNEIGAAGDGEQFSERVFMNKGFYAQEDLSDEALDKIIGE